jgi:hypothetical protein
MHKSVTRHDGTDTQSWHRYICAHCGTVVAGAVLCEKLLEKRPVRWLMCPNCADGSVLASDGNVYPGRPFGPVLEGLPDNVSTAYGEARRCMSVNAFTACELLCRKLLMYVAVEKGAAEGDTFANYLAHLGSQGYVTPPMKGWVGLIREHGNKAAHELEAPDPARAESTLMFTAELLRLVYEMAYMASKYASQP